MINSGYVTDQSYIPYGLREWLVLLFTDLDDMRILDYNSSFATPIMRYEDT